MKGLLSGGFPLLGSWRGREKELHRVSGRGKRWLGSGENMFEICGHELGTNSEVGCMDFLR